jgi:hypothetical protein
MSRADSEVIDVHIEQQVWSAPVIQYLEMIQYVKTGGCSAAVY